MFAQETTGDCSSTNHQKGQMYEWCYKHTLKWDTSPYKAYIINGMPFRLLYPKNYSTDDPGKKYPLMIMLHGIGEDGWSSGFDNEEQIKDGGQRHLSAVNNGTYDGFVMAPQSVGCHPDDDDCSSVFSTPEREAIAAFIDLAIKDLRVDEYRVMLQGYSAGGGAGWKIANDNPTKITGAILMSSSEPNMHIPWRETLKYTSIWHAQGGLDGRPAPSAANRIKNAYEEIGANYRLQEYPKIGHGTWFVMYTEPGFFPYMMRTHMLRPHALYFKQNFCPGEEPNGTMGIKQGFYQFEWQKDGVTVQNDSRNELVFSAVGSYQVRIKKTADSDWSEWGPPLQIKKIDYTKPVEIYATSSTALPTLDDKYFVTIKAPKLDPNGEPYQDYHWYKDDVLQEKETSDSLVTSKPGVYSVVVTEQLGCPSPVHSNSIKVSNEINPDLGIPANFTANSVSETELRLNWEDNSNETSFELYGNRTNEAPWELIATLPANTTTYSHKELNSYTRYFYRLRAVNNEGSTAYLEKDYVKTTGKTKKVDVSASAPTGLKVTSSSRTTISLQWNSPTGSEEEGVLSYEVYDVVNATIVATTKNRDIALNNLAEKQWFTFAIRAVDIYGNKSPYSNQVTAGTFNQGLIYTYYEADIKSVGSIAGLTPVKTGSTATFDINANPQRPKDRYAYKFEGFIIIPETGSYTFYTESDDGSTLSINGSKIVDNDGLHASEEKSGQVSLTAGAHKIEVLYFERTGSGEMLKVSWEGPGLAKETIPASALKDEYTQPNVPTAPSEFTATTKDGNNILLKWTDNSDNETGFEINRSTSNSGPFTYVTTAGANVVEYIDINLQPDTRYYYQIRSLSNGGGSDFIGKDADGIWVNAKTEPGSGGTEINAPSQLTASRQDANTVVLNWQDNASNEEGFEIYRNSKLISKTTNSNTSFTDVNAGGTATYTYRVKAYNSNVTSGYSNTATILGTNSAPVLSKVGTIYARRDDVTNIKLVASDKENDALAYSAQNLPAFATFVDNHDGTASLNLQPLRDDMGTYEGIVLEVSDGNGGSFSETVSIEVGENAAPGIMEIASMSLYEKSTQTAEVRAWDGNGEILDFTIEGAPTFIEFTNRGNNTGYFTIAPNYGHAGEYAVKVKVTDSHGASNWANFTVVVAPVETSQKVLVNFNDSSNEQAPAPWNNVARYPAIGTKLSGAKDVEGNATTIDIRFLDGFIRAEAGAVTGSNANSTFPDAVLKTHYYGWTDKDRKIKISGLDKTLYYNITIIGSKATTDDAPIITRYTIGNESKTLDVRNNTSQAVSFDKLQAPTGELTLTVRQQDPTQYSYINGIIIEASYEDNSVPTVPTQLSATLTESGIVELSWLDNACNESGYELQRSTDGVNFTSLGSFEANTSDFTDVDVTYGSTYHYRVQAVSAANNQSSSWSEVSTIKVEDEADTDPEEPTDPTDPTDPTNPTDPTDPEGPTDPTDPEEPTDPADPNNRAPVIDEAFPKVLHAIQGQSKTYEYSVTDENVEDEIALITRYLPSFASVNFDAETKKIVITLDASYSEIGYYSGVQLTATDGALEDDVTFSISITESEKISTYINFMYDHPLRGGRPWNNTNVVPGNKAIENLQNESNMTEPFKLTLLNSWNGANEWGETTLDNSGVFPDAVTKTSYRVNKGNTARIKITGLDPSLNYNFVFFGSSVYKSLGGNTTYTIGSETVSLPVQSNIDNTVQINGVKPPANGEVTIALYSDGLHGSFLNAMVIEKYSDASKMMSPGNLRAHASIKQNGKGWAHQIDLKWTDRSKGEDQFNIYRRTLPSGTFVQIGTTDANTTSYSDRSNLSADTGYEYYVKAAKGGTESDASQISQAATLKHKILINFNYGGSYNAPSTSWNNFNRIPRESSKNNLINERGNSTPVDLRIEENFNGYNNRGPKANGTGIYPDPVSEQFYFVELGSYARLKISDLDPSQTYNFRFYAATEYPNANTKDNGVTIYKIGNKKVSLDAQFNLTNTAVIRDVVAPDKEVFIELEGGEYAKYGYINALEIEVRDGNKEKVDPSVSTKYQQDAASTASLVKVQNEITTVYPNPVSDEMFVNFMAEHAGVVELEVINLQGRTVHQQQANAREGENIFTLDLRKPNINKGIYILRIKSMDFTSKVVRFMKQ
ncbi:PA14 domain-containing protein [Flammeovirgaceae bacterium 311]|nr:PA14 domain-containing protein [Flammeovirgaceae bacterium 311]